MTGTHNQTKISVPGNQMFITFESSSFTKKGFKAFIYKIGIDHKIEINIVMFFKIYFLSINVDDKCQYWMDLEKMKLSTPNFPKLIFADGVGCYWIITAPEGNIISLEVLHMDGDQNIDVLIFLHTYIYFQTNITY